MTQAEQSPGQVEDPSLSQRFEEKHTEIMQSKADQMTVAERLTRRALTDTIRVPFSDDLGEFEIEIRMPPSRELDKFLELQKDIQNAVGAGDQEKADTLTAALYSQMEGLTTDPSLTAEYFKDGDFLASDFGQIIKEIMMEEKERTVAASSFRQK